MYDRKSYQLYSPSYLKVIYVEYIYERINCQLLKILSEDGIVNGNWLKLVVFSGWKIEKDFEVNVILKNM